VKRTFKLRIRTLIKQTEDHEVWCETAEEAIEVLAAAAVRSLEADNSSQNVSEWARKIADQVVQADD